MTQVKYVGLDVHQASIVADVHDGAGQCLQQAIIATSAEAVRDFLRGLSGSVHVTFEEGTQAEWLYQLVRPLVAEVIVCNPRRNKLLREGNKGDRPDAHHLAELLRGGLLKPVVHGHAQVQTLKELVRTYEGLVGDCTRVMLRLKALFRSRAIATPGPSLYAPAQRSHWLARLSEVGARHRAQSLFAQLDALLPLRKAARQALLAESRKHPVSRRLHQVPGLGPVRAALIIATVSRPERFRTKRQLWAYCGLAVRTSGSAEYEFAGGRLQRRKRALTTRGLNPNYNRRLKAVFKAAALTALSREPFASYYASLLAKGSRPELARLTLARKLVAITLTIWKKGVAFDAAQVTTRAA